MLSQSPFRPCSRYQEPLPHTSPGALICLLPVNHGEDENGVSIDPEDHAIVADSELPIGFKGLPQGLRVVLQLLTESRLDCVSDSLFGCAIDSRQIASLNRWMVIELVAHSAFHTSSCETAVSGS